MIHGPSDTWHPFTASDIQIISRIGACPIKVMDFTTDQDLAWLAWMGFAAHDLVLRAWVDHGGVPDPAAHVAGIVRRVRAVQAAGFRRIAVQFSCEDELERYNVGWPTLRAWSLDVIGRLRADLPEVEIVSTPIIPAGQHSWEARCEMDSVITRCDTVGAHVKWWTVGDLAEGAPWGVEWWHGQFPDRDLRLLEVGGWPGTDEDWRVNTYPTMLRRMVSRRYVRSVHVWLVRSEDPAFVADHYTDRITSIIANVAEDWRAARPFVVEVIP